MPVRPNILLITSHDTGRYLQPYGHAVPTPHLQRLAEEGVLFRQAFSAAPTCSPSRAALLTGQDAHSSGMLGLAHRGFALRDERQHLLHTLRAAGYHSALIGFQHIAKDADRIGYDRVVRGANSAAGTVAPAVAAFLAQAPPQPFFLEVGFSETHRRFPAPRPEDDPRYCLPPAPLPDTPETREDMAAFKASAHALDAGVGTVLAALAAHGLAGDTLVIYTTDHGIAFPGMKCTLTDAGIGVSLVARGPGGFAGGRVCDALVSQIDLFPTICELLALPRPPWLRGVSLLPLVHGEVEEVRDEVFAEVSFHAAYEPQRAVRTARWKYIRRFDAPPRPGTNCDGGPSKDLWLRHGWSSRLYAPEQLYDLVFDPHEGHNLIDDPAAGAPLAELRRRLDRWMQATDDPLLRGAVPAPPGTQLIDPRSGQPWVATPAGRGAGG